MRSSIFSFLLVFTSLVLASNWSPEDQEIFRLNELIQQDLGLDVTFYSWLGLKKGSRSKLDEITKAYRRKSIQMHPDKLSSSSKAAREIAEERFQRLTLVSNILRDNSLKKRYDYFLDKGFPKWKDTGYIYTKFRPGIILTVLILLMIFSIFQYFALKINRKQDFQRLKMLKEDIRTQAWGSPNIPPSEGSDRKITNEVTGKQFLVQSSGNVGLLVDDGLLILDENEINLKPSMKDLFLFKVIACSWNKTLGKLLSVEINTTVLQNKSSNSNSIVSGCDKKVKKKRNKIDRKVLPNGKVAYGRPGGPRRRK